MSEGNNERRRTLDKRIVLFFVFAIACVAAFLIVILVKSCDADHEADKEEEVLLENNLGQLPSESQDIIMLA